MHDICFPGPGGFAGGVISRKARFSPRTVVIPVNTMVDDGAGGGATIRPVAGGRSAKRFLSKITLYGLSDLAIPSAAAIVSNATHAMQTNAKLACVERSTGLKKAVPAGFSGDDM
jgi:hypothetical protein